METISPVKGVMYMPLVAMILFGTTDHVHQRTPTGMTRPNDVNTSQPRVLKMKTMAMKTTMQTITMATMMVTMIIHQC